MRKESAIAGDQPHRKRKLHGRFCKKKKSGFRRVNSKGGNRTKGKKFGKNSKGAPEGPAEKGSQPVRKRKA